MNSQPQQRVARLARPVGSQPPSDRKLDDSYTLDGRSLNTLRPGEWLDDVVINTFLRSLCLAQPGKCVTFDSAVLLPLLVALESEDSEPTAIDELYQPFRTLAATVTGNQGLVFMPFCVNNHWVLAVADFQNQAIRVYDSMVFRDETGKVVPSELVTSILPCVKGTLSFCMAEDQWAVEHMWLPIITNTTECGVYVCLMALQHAYMPGFHPDECIGRFWHWTGDLAYYGLNACYWLVGRKIILQVCRRYFQPTPDDAPLTPLLVEHNINEVWNYCVVTCPAGVPFYRLMPYFDARSRTLYQVLDALTWVIDSIDSLGSTQHVHLSESIQNKAREMVLTPPGEPFLNEIVDEAVSYAWHDVEALQKLEQDLRHVRYLLHQDVNYAQARLNDLAAASYGPGG